MRDVQIGELVRIFRIGLVSPGLDAEAATSCSLCSPRIVFGVTRDFFLVASKAETNGMSPGGRTRGSAPYVSQLVSCFWIDLLL